MACDWHFSSVKVFSDVQLLCLYLVHICLLISHGNCFCAPLKWTLRKFDSWWCKHLQTHVATVIVFPHWFAVVLHLLLKFQVKCSSFFYQKQLWHWLCDSVKCVKYTWGVTPFWIEPVLVTIFGLYLISWVIWILPDLFISFRFCLLQVPGKSDQCLLLLVD